MKTNSNSFEDAHEFLLKLCSAGKCESFKCLLVIHSECLHCKHSTLLDDEVFGISCDINDTLAECLSSMLSPCIENWFCPGCHQQTQMSKTCSILSDPDVLLIQFQRFTFSGGAVKKLSSLVNFPLTGFLFHGISYSLSQ